MSIATDWSTRHQILVLAGMFLLGSLLGQALEQTCAYGHYHPSVANPTTGEQVVNAARLDGAATRLWHRFRLAGLTGQPAASTRRKSNLHPRCDSV